METVMSSVLIGAAVLSSTYIYKSFKANGWVNENPYKLFEPCSTPPFLGRVYIYWKNTPPPRGKIYK